MPHKFKVTLFGPPAVGKTSILLKYIKDFFSNSLKKTIGSNFLIKDLTIDGTDVRLLLWDIGGQERFQHLRQIYFKGSNASLGVFDVTNKQTLIKIPGWISSIKKSVKKGIPMLLVGNKIDLERKVEREEAEKLANKLGCEYMETSAKTGENIDDVFKKIAKACLEAVGVE